MKFSHILSVALGFVNLVAALDPLTIKGNKFFNKDGSQFFLKGIAYQRSPRDPLIDPAQCKMDADLMGKLGANSIRVYHVDASKDHDECMEHFARNGIYLFVDADTFNTQIEQDGPPHWNKTQLERFTKVVDAFHKYDNTAGFFVGNEIITRSNGSHAAPYIRAATRDVKKWIKDQKYPRDHYVGYSAADIAELRPNLQNYLVCGDDDDSKLDFFGLNAYEWCGDSSYKVSGYDQLTKNATDYPVPIFLSEDGCNTVQPRDFADQEAIFGPEMARVWSGVIIYEWIQEANDYGIISYGGEVDTKTAEGGDPYMRSGKPTPLPDFTALSKQWAAATPTGVSEKDYKPTSKSMTCPAYTRGQWNVDPSGAIPSLGQTANANGEVETRTGGGSASPTETQKSHADKNTSSSSVFIALTIFLAAAITLL